MNVPRLLQRSPKGQERDERVGESLGYQAHGVAVVGTPSAMILQEATTLRSDLILMGTRGLAGHRPLRARSRVSWGVYKVLCSVLAFR